MKQKPQSPAGLGGSKERDWGLAGVALLVTSALLTGLLLIGIEKDWGGAWRAAAGHCPARIRWQRATNRPAGRRDRGLARHRRKSRPNAR